MTRMNDLAMDIASIPDLKKLPINVVDLSAEQLARPIEQDPQKIEIDLGPVKISIFHRKCPYLLTTEGLKAGWHFLLTTYTPDHKPAGPGLHAEETAVDQMMQYIRKRANEHGWPKAEKAKSND
jgi:hypothetical protein